MFTDLVQALKLDDTQLVMLFVALLVGAAVLFIAYLLWKWAVEEAKRRKNPRLKQRKAKLDPEPGKDDEEESYIMTLYDLLDVNKKATSEQIRAAYRNKCKNMHPDKTGREDRKFISRLNQAKDTLLNAKERKRYDEYLARREEGWIRQMAGELEGDEQRIRIKGQPIPRLAPGEQVLKKKSGAPGAHHSLERKPSKKKDGLEE